MLTPHRLRVHTHNRHITHIMLNALHWFQNWNHHQSSIIHPSHFIYHYHLYEYTHSLVIRRRANILLAIKWNKIYCWDVACAGDVLHVRVSLFSFFLWSRVQACSEGCKYLCIHFGPCCLVPPDGVNIYSHNIEQKKNDRSKVMNMIIRFVHLCWVRYHFAFSCARGEPLTSYEHSASIQMIHVVCKKRSNWFRRDETCCRCCRLRIATVRRLH